jgi:hypothetical protein
VFRVDILVDEFLDGLGKGKVISEKEGSIVSEILREIFDHIIKIKIIIYRDDNQVESY